jgi:hypothetical protein
VAKETPLQISWNLEGDTYPRIQDMQQELLHIGSSTGFAEIMLPTAQQARKSSLASRKFASNVGAHSTYGVFDKRIFFGENGPVVD